MKTIKIPQGIDVYEIEKDIIRLESTINDKFKNKAFEWAERILLYLNEIRKGQLTNQRYFLKDRISEDEIKWAQIPKEVRNLILPESIYLESIKKYLFDNYIEVNKLHTTKHGVVEFFVIGKKCKQYAFKNQPTMYEPYVLAGRRVDTIDTKIRSNEGINDELSEVQNDIRKHTLQNTDKIKLLNNHNTRAILSHHLKNKKVNIKPTTYIKTFDSQEFRNSCDSYSFRLHSKVTNLKKNLIPHCRVNDNSIVSIDIVNSQPYLYSNIDSNLINKLVMHNPKMNYLLKVIPVIEKWELESDYQLFKELSLKGGLYEYMMKSYKRKFNEKIERKIAKKAVFYNIFSKIKTHNRVDEEEKVKFIDCFKTSFPSVYKCIDEIQRLNFNLPILQDFKKGYLGYKNSSLMLQRVESTIVFDFLIPKIIEKGIWYTTVHDCVLCEQGNEEIIKGLFIETFTELELPIPQLEIK